MTSVSSPVCGNMGGMVQEVSERVYPFIPISDLSKLLSVYFKTPYAVLLDRENIDALADAKAITYDGDNAGPTTGESLFRLQWRNVDSVIKQLEEMTVSVSGVQYQGRYAYVLACWVGFENPHNPENDIHGPVPTRKNTESAIKAFLKLIKDFL